MMNKHSQSRLSSMCVLVAVAALASAALLLASSAAADPRPSPLSGWGTATIDGSIGISEWAGADFRTLDVNLPDGTTTPAVFYVMNDTSNLYWALQVELLPGLSVSSFDLQFNNDNDNWYEPGDDWVLVNAGGQYPFTDGFQTAELYSLSDESDGGTQDGGRAVGDDGAYFTYEVWHLLDSADDAHDMSVQGGDKVGVYGSLRVFTSSGYADTTVVGYGWPKPFADLVIADAITEQLFDLLDSVSGLTSGTSLTDKVEDALAGYTDGKLAKACSSLSSFINEVQAQSGKASIDESTANQLIADADAIIAAIGC